MVRERKRSIDRLNNDSDYSKTRQRKRGGEREKKRNGRKRQRARGKRNWREKERGRERKREGERKIAYTVKGKLF